MFFIDFFSMLFFNKNSLLGKPFNPDYSLIFDKSIYLSDK
ncbi:Uncharacterized protein dnm_030830 [Desulfonema magnum]|uniref:Uncharacterized protein n=1 Tax=Desulfonema magnum TaxID=45655 RepID=A0A975GMM8_9BACT|nr:Uncharacterized protein dnm_030830 [Desulfonema magnum]